MSLSVRESSKIYLRSLIEFLSDGRYMSLVCGESSTELEIEHYPNAALFPEEEKALMMASMNEIIGENWAVKTAHWSVINTPFNPSYSLVSIKCNRQIVGFSVYKVFALGDEVCVYRSGTEIRRSMQNRGIYGLINAHILSRIFDQNEELKQVYYCWRTRNAIVTHTHMQLCSELIPIGIGKGCPSPSIPEFLAKTAARSLYPDVELDLPSCVMRGVYGHIEHRRPNYRGSVKFLAQQIECLAPKTGDAIFFVGLIRRRAFR